MEGDQSNDGDKQAGKLRVTACSPPRLLGHLRLHAGFAVLGLPVHKDKRGRSQGMDLAKRGPSRRRKLKRVYSTSRRMPHPPRRMAQKQLRSTGSLSLMRRRGHRHPPPSLLHPPFVLDFRTQKKQRAWHGWNSQWASARRHARWQGPGLFAPGCWRCCAR